MFIKVLKISMIASLLLILVGGSVYILARPTETRADYFEQDGADGLGRHGDQQSLVASEVCETCGVGSRGASNAVAERGRTDRVVAQEETCGDENDQLPEENGGGEYDQLGEGRGADPGSDGQGLETQSVWADAEQPAWETVQGRVTDTGHDLLVEIPGEGEVLVGLGPEFYREEHSFELSVGDEIVVQGYHEDGEFTAGFVENLTTRSVIVLRDIATGRPMWSGRGDNRNRS
ncbi:MAG: hypothetical protein MUQ30_15915 [Anaerolineae bacterium]|nr:hypothetical protein [Anaerolineae bacterium]